MKEFGRLLRYVAPYSWALILSVVLMVVVGAAHGMVALLVGQVFGRVLKPDAPDMPVDLFTIPVDRQNDLPRATHARLDQQRLDDDRLRDPGHLPHQRHLRLRRQLPDQLRGRFRRHRPAAAGVRQGAAAGRAVLRDALHRQADVVDHERHREDPGRHLAHAGGLPPAGVHRRRPADRDRRPGLEARVDQPHAASRSFWCPRRGSAGASAVRRGTRRTTRPR